MHADRPGERPRILYWYRTAPGIVLGRAPLDEDAIRAIEEQHPEIDFDWPAILALSEVMTPEDEAPPPSRSQPAGGRRKPREPRRDRERATAGVSTEAEATPPGDHAHVSAAAPEGAPRAAPSAPSAPVAPSAPSLSLGTLDPGEPRNLLLEELAGREIGARLRMRHAEIVARIGGLDVDGATKDALFTRAEAIDPELWMTPESVLEGVRNADALFDALRAEVGQTSRE